jgi:hypothetical protein
MKQLQHVAQFAAQKRIRGRSYKRSSLLKPLDFILAELERCPDPDDPNEIEFARTSSKGLILDHVKRIARGVHEEDIYQYVNVFFDEVLHDAHHGNVNQLLQRERSLRSAYLVYTREALAQIFVERGKAQNDVKAIDLLDQQTEDDDDDDDNDNAPSL